jgi:hypothetical protein
MNSPSSPTAYSDRKGGIIDSPELTANLFAYCKHKKINALSLYDLWGILGEWSNIHKLRTFIKTARSNGILTVEAIGDETRAFWDRVKTYQYGDGDRILAGGGLRVDAYQHH